MIGAEDNLSSLTALRLVELDGLPSNNTVGPVSARALQDVRKNHSKQTREERPGRFSKKRAPTGQHNKMLKQVRAPPNHVKKRAYTKQVEQKGEVERCGYLKFKVEETIFAANQKAEMRKAQKIVVASWDIVKTLLWPGIIPGTDLYWMQSISMAIGVQR